MTTTSRMLTVLFATLLLAGLWGHQATAQQEIGITGITGEMKSLTATVGPETTVVLLSVPDNSNFVLTQACHTTGTGSDYRFHNVGEGGTGSQLTLDNTECEQYTPGVVFAGGSEVEFRNNSGSASIRLLANGILTKK